MTRSALSRRRGRCSRPRAALDWSFDLLPLPERALLCRLGVFAGSAGIDALEGICPGGLLDATNLLDCLAHLVDLSLVQVHEQDGVARYRLLDTVRQYALGRLRDIDEESTVRARHAAWCAGFVEQAEPDLLARDQLVTLAKLERDHDNLRTALASTPAVAA